MLSRQTLKKWTVGALVALVCVGLSRSADAQTTSGSIAGNVRDATGALLPGVTVEAASPALIEKVRTVVTDDQGNYSIEALRPGTYSVTFSLSGFRTFKRENVQLGTGVTVTANAAMELGGVEESITVSGATSIVDIRGTQQASVFTQEVQAALPLGRQISQWSAVTPQVVETSTRTDVGGTQAKATYLSAHGVSGLTAGAGAQGMYYDGINVMSPQGAQGFMFNEAATEESQVQTSGYTAEVKTGNVQLNIIPRDGGNSFRFTSSGSYMAWQDDNFDSRLAARNAAAGGKNNYVRTANIGFGGPIKADRLWFYGAYLRSGLSSIQPGGFYNTDVTSYVYVPDRSRGYSTDVWERDIEGRLTWQATAKDKFNFHATRATNCQCIFGTTGRSAEADILVDQTTPLLFATWTRPATNRLLFEAGVGALRHSSEKRPQTSLGVTSDAIAVLDQGTNTWYRASATAFNLAAAYGNDRLPQTNGRFAASYITGSHSLKAGFQFNSGTPGDVTIIPGDVTYRTFNGVANQITMFASPADTIVRAVELGFYAQDQWTIRRWTLNVGARIDQFKGWVPEQDQPAGRWLPARHYDRIDDVPNWWDITPRVAAAYDLFGNGKTAVKSSIGKYVAYATAGSAVLPQNPVITASNSATRNWTDANGDWVPQENELGPLSNSRFGQNVNTTSYADDVMRGWGVRDYNWQFGAQVQHQLLERMAVNVGYFRTWFGNFQTTDNRLVTPQDYSPYCITAPVDARLPASVSGQQVCGLYDLSPAKVGQVDNLVTQASNFGKQRQVFNGVDATLQWRFMTSGMLTGGISTGTTTTDNCEQRIDSPDRRFCDNTPPWAAGTNIRFGYVVPLPLDLRLSGAVQNNAGVPITATYAASNAEIAPSLGRNLSACPANSTITSCTARVNVALLGPSDLYEERSTLVDVRLARILRIGKTRFEGQLDVFNIFNSNSVRLVNNTFGPLWQQPLGILGARMVKLGFQVQF
jgi:hypothetical protein